MQTTNQMAEMIKSATLGTSRYGSHEPQLEICLHKSTNHRELLAALHELAAQVERATPRWECWLVNIERCASNRGRVFLELMEATDAEAERGLALLRKFAD